MGSLIGRGKGPVNQGKTPPCPHPPGHLKRGWQPGKPPLRAPTTTGNTRSAERWQSGRSRRTRNAKYSQGYRGFESLPLRHLSPPPITGPDLRPQYLAFRRRRPRDLGRTPMRATPLIITPRMQVVRQELKVWKASAVMQRPRLLGYGGQSLVPKIYIGHSNARWSRCCKCSTLHNERFATHQSASPTVFCRHTVIGN